MGGARPQVVRVLTGHLVHIFSLARPLLSAVHRLHRFQGHPLDRWRKFSRAELRTLAGVVWLSECELGQPFSHVVFCSDATLSRYRVQCTTASFGELKEATRFLERWRFRTREISHTPPVRHADEVTRLGAVRREPEQQDNSGPVVSFGRTADFEEVSTRYGAWLDSQGLRTWRTAMQASSPNAVEVEECTGAVRRLPKAWNDPALWHTVIEGNFKFKEAVHMKEGRAALLSLRRAVAGTAGHGHRLLSLTDNMSCLLAFHRGRSRSYDPLCLCRRAAALCIGADVSWVLRHLETWRNPSDEGS